MTFLDFLRSKDNIDRNFSISSPHPDSKPMLLCDGYAFMYGLNYLGIINLPKSEKDDVLKVLIETLSGEPVWSFERSRKKGTSTHIFQPQEDVLLTLSIGSQRNVSGMVFATNREVANKWVNALVETFPLPKTKMKPDQVPVLFWSYSANDGAISRTRDLNALDWNQIAKNYPGEVRSELDKLVTMDPPSQNAGKLLLWHGEPGTGKSSAIRSIIQSWLPWCDPAYVLDPERFFNNPDYMMEVCLDTPSNDYYWDDDDEELEDILRDNILEGDKRWRLLIIEDADEFIQVDAKDRTGQALSRLLNLGDGLIGQGLNFLTLITTNEKLGNIHAAVKREGRCLANIEFDNFTATEAATWCKQETGLVLPEHRDSWTLAQLYELKKDAKDKQVKVEKPQAKVGVYL